MQTGLRGIMSLFKVKLKQVKLFGHHGVLEEEKENGQDYFIDINYSFRREQEEDDIGKTVDYSKVVSVAREVFESKRYDLLENLAQDIVRAILSKESAIEKVRVSVWKKSPKVGAQTEAVCVSVKENK